MQDNGERVWPRGDAADGGRPTDESRRTVARREVAQMGDGQEPGVSEVAAAIVDTVNPRGHDGHGIQLDAMKDDESSD